MIDSNFSIFNPKTKFCNKIQEKNHKKNSFQKKNNFFSVIYVYTNNSKTFRDLFLISDSEKCGNSYKERFDIECQSSRKRRKKIICEDKNLKKKLT